MNNWAVGDQRYYKRNIGPFSDIELWSPIEGTTFADFYRGKKLALTLIYNSAFDAMNDIDGIYDE